MKPSKSSGIFKPFKNLNVLLECKEIKLKPESIIESNETNKEKPDRRNEQVLFKEAMANVKRISRKNCAYLPASSQTHPSDKEKLEYESVEQLEDLVRYGTGFIVSLTPEYIEGTARAINPDIARRLHRGDFSIQTHIDLHGLGVEAAHEAFDGFLNKSIMSGKRAVLIIHGRGLSSPAEPILKTKVYQWLTSSPWHKRVLAFTSARLCDGGAGATYVLLSQRPLTKRSRKRSKKR